MLKNAFWGIALAVFILLTAGTGCPGSTPPPTPSQGLIDLGSLGGGNASAASINNHDQIVGSSRNASGASHAYLWDGTHGMQDLGIMQEGSSGGAYAINDAGQVVGVEISMLDVTMYGFLWDSSEGMRNLDMVDGQQAVAAEDINNSGQVVGWLYEDYAYTDGFLWDPTDGMQTLASVCGQQGLACAINDSGQICAMSLDYMSAFFWDSDSEIYTIINDSEDDWFYVPASLNNSGVVVGYYYQGLDVRGFIWNEEDGFQELATLGGTSRAFDINNAGQVVGSSVPEDSDVAHAFYWDADTGVLDLNDLIEPDSGWVLEKASSINDSGHIVGTGTYNGEPNHAFLFTGL